MTTADWALLISLCSVLVSFASFAWNVWSKFIYPKAKVRTSFAVKMSFEAAGAGQPPINQHRFLGLSATNYGPGAVTLHMATGRTKGRLVDRLLRRPGTIGILLPLHGIPMVWNQTIGPFGGGLPKKIDVGENFSSYFIFEHEELRDGGYIDVGFEDTFGRIHWAPRSQVRQVVETIRKDFPAAPAGAEPPKLKFE